MIPTQQIAWTQDAIRRFWDHESQRPEHYFTHQCGSEIVRTLRPYLRGRWRVLDYGCGAGGLIPHLLADEYEVTGVDPSPDSRAVVSTNFGHHPAFRGVRTVEEARAGGAVRYDSCD